MERKTETYKYREGQQLHLDEIYEIQGLANGDWWDHDHDDSDDIHVTRDVTIVITVYS